MNEKKISRESILKTLQESAAEVAKWPEWMRRAASTESVFRVPTHREQREPVQVNSTRVISEPELAK